MTKFIVKTKILKTFDSGCTMSCHEDAAVYGYLIGKTNKELNLAEIGAGMDWRATSVLHTLIELFNQDVIELSIIETD